MSLSFIHVHKVFKYGLQEVLRFFARSDYHSSTSLCADKNGLFIFSGRKRQRGKLVRVDQQINARQTA